jgi:hypothetical protein
MRLMLGVADGGAPPEPVVVADADRCASRERLRLAQCAAAGRPMRCCACAQRWSCEARLHLDEISDAARRRYAVQVHADWLAGTPSVTGSGRGGAAR